MLCHLFSSFTKTQLKKVQQGFKPQRTSLLNSFVLNRTYNTSSSSPTTSSSSYTTTRAYCERLYRASNAKGLWQQLLQPPFCLQKHSSLLQAKSVQSSTVRRQQHSYSTGAGKLEKHLKEALEKSTAWQEAFPELNKYVTNNKLTIQVDDATGDVLLTKKVGDELLTIRVLHTEGGQEFEHEEEEAESVEETEAQQDEEAKGEYENEEDHITINVKIEKPSAKAKGAITFVCIAKQKHIEIERVTIASDDGTSKSLVSDDLDANSLKLFTNYLNEKQINDDFCLIAQNALDYSDDLYDRSFLEKAYNFFKKD